MLIDVGGSVIPQAGQASVFMTRGVHLAVHAIIDVVQYFGWQSLSIYFQTADNERTLAQDLTGLMRTNGLEVKLSLPQSKGGDLLYAKHFLGLIRTLN